MIQAIEGNYEVPASYLQEKQQRDNLKLLEAAQTEKSACAICKGTGFRNVKTALYPNGAMRDALMTQSLKNQLSSCNFTSDFN